MTTRLVITLEVSERQALGELAQIEMRDPRDQVRFMLREKLIEQGFLQGETAVSPDSHIEGVQHANNPG